MTELAETPLTVPKLMFLSSAEEVESTAREGLDRARRILQEILETPPPRTVDNTLTPYNDLMLEIVEVSSQGDDLSNLHPEAALRDAGEKVHLEAQRLDTEISLNRPLYEAFQALDVAGEEEDTQFAVFKVLRDFRRAGVDRDEETRSRIKGLRDEIVAIGQEFDRNIRDDVRSIRVSPEALAGLPEDFVEGHPTDEEGKVTLTTNYPDLFPVLRYARSEEVRRQLLEVYLNRGHPANLQVLERLLATRHELATLLGKENFADYVTEDKMIGSGRAAAEFIDKVTLAAETRAQEDLASFSSRKRADTAGPAALQAWDRFYYPELVRQEKYAVDAKEVRAYFPFAQVLGGLLRVTGELFHLRYEAVEDSPVWHESVRVYDVYDGSNRLGRFYLDLHPRNGKYTHAASATVVRGLRSVQLPQGLLMCNFPDPQQGPALMEHSDVVTFFHEFGHLIHGMLSGRIRWTKNAMSAVEWDFVEVPSQLLEEWARDPEVLQSFATHYQTGAPIPRELVERMKKADGVARGLNVRRQMALAALSLRYYNRDPAGVDTTQLAQKVHEEYDLLPWFQGTHFQCGFGHLNGYSAIYYTYMWSLVIAKDLFSRFQGQGSLMEGEEALRYRRAILEQGSNRPAVKMVEEFLGRPTSFEAYEAWLQEPA